MTFERILNGYRRAISPDTGDSYVVRTRPLNDGWMAINDSEGIVLATGQSLWDAKSICESYDLENVYPAIELAPEPDPIVALRDSDEAFESLIASYHTR
jgi:hypothetical protein